MALQSPVTLEVSVASGDMSASSTHDIGTVPDNCVIISAGAECTAAATVGGANAVSFGVTGGDVDGLGTADINAAKTAGSVVTTTGGATTATTAETTFTAKLAATNTPSAGTYRFFVVYVPAGATRAAATAARDNA